LRGLSYDTCGVFPLTTAADTASANLFTSDVVVSGNFALNTLNNGDRLTGTGTNATLNATINTAQGAAFAIAPALLSGIQTVNLTFSNLGGAAQAFTLNGGNSTGLLNLTSSSAGAAVVVNGLTTALTTVGISNTAFAQAVVFADAALSSATNSITVAADTFTGAVALNLNATTAGASAYETVNIASNGTVTNVFNLATNGAGVTTVNVSGAAGFTTINASANLALFNAATATGVITYTAGGEGIARYVGGTASDVITLAGTYTNADTVDGGLGSNNRLAVTNVIATGITTVGNAQTNITNIQTLELTDGLTGTVSVNLFGATAATAATRLRFGANSAAAGTVNYATGTNGLDFQQFTLAADLIVNIAGTATTDVLNITIGSATAGSALGRNVTLNGVETANITSQGGANTFSNFILTDTAAAEIIVLTGDQATVFGIVGADSINASALTGTTATLNIASAQRAINITGSINNDTLNGSTGADIINGGTGNDQIANVITGTAATAADVLTGGTGFDTFTLRGDQASAGGGLAGQYSTVAQITDFLTGSTTTTTDILQLSADFRNYGGASAFFAGVVAAAAGATSIQGVATNAAAAAIVVGTDLIKLTTAIATAGLTAQQAFNAAIGTATVTGFTAGDDIFVSFYDTTNSRLVVGLGNTGAGDAVLATADVFTVIGSLSISAADYAAFSNTNLAIINP